jgi:hypothetical protein
MGGTLHLAESEETRAEAAVPVGLDRLPGMGGKRPVASHANLLALESVGCWFSLPWRKSVREFRLDAESGGPVQQPESPAGSGRWTLTLSS